MMQSSKKYMPDATLDEEDARLLSQMPDRSFTGVDHAKIDPMEIEMSIASNSTSSSPKSPISAITTCPQCGRNVVNAKVSCPLCDSVYHRSCAGLTKKLQNGGFSKCCSKGPVVLSIEDRSKIVDDICSKLAKQTAESQAKLADDISLRVSKQVAEQMSRQLDAIIAKHVNVLRDEVARDIETVRQSVSTLQSTTEGNDRTRGEEIRELGDRITSIEEDLSVKLTTILSGVSPDPQDASKAKAELIDNCLDEMDDRMSRLRNVVIFGIPEPKHHLAIERKSDDTNRMLNIIAESGVLAESSDTVKCFRLGKYSPNLLQPRPIKLILSSAANANLLVQNHLRLKKLSEGSSLIKDILIFPDQTDLQRKRAKQLKTKLLERRRQEMNPLLKIVHRNGVGKIVTVRPRKDSTSVHPPQQQ